MKKLLLSLPFITIGLFICVTPKGVNAQVGTIITYASISACNIAVDNSGKLYTASGANIEIIDSGGSTTSVVGGGTTYGDGGPASAAKLTDAGNLVFDHAGNMYIADNGYGVVRKVNSAGIISTVAGNYTLGAGYTGDGGAATAAQVVCSRVCLDPSGNIFIADYSHNVVRKVDAATGIISAVAGNGTSGYSGDGGPATAAEFNISYNGYCGIVTDAAGNLYLSDGQHMRVRKVNTAGIITTIAGNGLTGSGGVGGPATSANIYFPQGLTTDAAGNLYIAEWQNSVLAAVNTAGFLSTVAGDYIVSYSGDGGPATAAGMNAVADVAIDYAGNIYIADCHNNVIRKVTGSYLSATHVADSFGVFVNELCTGPQLGISTHSYNPSYSVKCYYGDGTTDSSAIASGLSGSGFVSFAHTYAGTGTYTVKVVLINGTTVFDSLSYTYRFKLCNALSTQFYYDANGNCIYDSGDSPISLPLLTEVDSNGVAVDTISSTSGIYYSAYGNPGDIYTFKIISYPGNMYATCPATGIVTDTIQSLSYNTNLKSIGLQCSTSSGFDLSLNAIVPVTGVHDQWGDIYVSNTSCAPMDATVTLHYSKHYNVDLGGGSLDVHPTPTSYTDSTVTWTVTGLDASAPAPVDLYYAIWTNPDSGMVVGYPARSYFTISPTSGDVDTSNNVEIKIDTVRGGCDPNEMDVTPSGYISAGTQLKYTINFTNTGNDTTYNIYVMDTLSDNVDISSFRLVMASANMNIAKLKSGGHNILKFDFPGINLLDSLHYPANSSRGLTFTINAKSGLPDGTTIFNRAGVYFDYNPVVLTNTVEDIIGSPSALSVKKIITSTVMVYPNPANTTLHMDNVLSETEYTISNLLGVPVQRGGLLPGANSVNIDQLPVGVYFVKIGDKVKKFVKQ